MRAGRHLGILEQDQGRLEVTLAESARVGGEFVGGAALDPVVLRYRDQPHGLADDGVERLPRGGPPVTAPRRRTRSLPP